MKKTLHRAAWCTAFLASCSAGLLTAVLPAQAATPGRGLPPEQGARVIVALKSTAQQRLSALSASSSRDVVALQAQQQANTLALAAGVPLTAGRLLGTRSMVVKADGLTSAELAARLSTLSDVAYAVPDRRRRATSLPNDPLFNTGPTTGLGPAVGQWYLRTPTPTVQSATNAQQAWDLVTPRSTLVVAVLDTGILRNHPDLAGGQVLTGRDFIEDLDTANDGTVRDTDPADPGDWITAAEDTRRGGPFEGCGEADSSWHGTQVAGIIGATANNNMGMSGAAPGVRILPVRVLGKCGGYDSDIIAGLRWAAGVTVPGEPANPNPARVLNLSLGGSDSCSQAYSDAVAEVGAAPFYALVVAAAGNSTGHAVGTPANCPGVLGVAGLRHTGSKVGFSDLGPEVGLAAPAGNCVNTEVNSACLYPILTTSNNGTRGPNAGGSIWTDSFNITVGTSFATPIVASAAALVLSARPEYTPAQVTTTLKRSARAFPTTGSDNGTDPTPVAMCRVPDGSDQLQCYCTSALCGAGMVDMAAAVADAQQQVSLDEGARQAMDFGERTYPTLLPGHPATQRWGPFAYRAYSNGIYLGVVVNSDPGYVINGVYLMGGVYGASPTFVGKVNDFITPSASGTASAARGGSGLRLR